MKTKACMLPAIVVTLFMCPFFWKCSPYERDSKERCAEIASESVNEKVSRKYRVRSNGNCPELAYTSGRRFAATIKYFTLWELAEVGDSIIKKAGSNVFEIHKADTILFATFYCQ